jgi:hypothetical protein
MHQPAWSLFSAIRLAGIEPVADGYRIAPHLPMQTFSLRLPNVGVAATPESLRGYIRPQRSGTIRLRVAPPAGADPNQLVVYAGQRRSRWVLRDGLAVFDLPASAGRAADWAVLAGSGARRLGPGPGHRN